MFLSLSLRVTVLLVLALVLKSAE